jgi:hypothetical protein
MALRRSQYSANMESKHTMLFLVLQSLDRARPCFVQSFAYQLLYYETCLPEGPRPEDARVHNTFM